MLASRTKRNVNEDTGKEGRKEKEEEEGREKKGREKIISNFSSYKIKEGRVSSLQHPS